MITIISYCNHIWEIQHLFHVTMYWYSSAAMVSKTYLDIIVIISHFRVI